jgi:hypothetical protein
MPILRATDHEKPQDLLAELTADSTLEDELDAMVSSVKECDPSAPDVIMSLCMALMARCTEIHLQLVRIEGTHRRARVFRADQLKPVMDLLDFEYKAASRLIEVRRQEVELSR